MKWVEIWYVAYALLGVSAAGLAPMLIPLVVGQNGGAADIGLAMAAFSLGGLTAPVWGGLADRFQLHRRFLIGGLIGFALGAAVFPFALSFFLRMMSVLLAGIGLTAASTVANLFIVEVHPREEWDTRIGWLQTFFSGGQVLGLLLAGLIGQTAPEKGLWLAGVLAVAAVIPAMLGTRREAAFLVQRRPVLLHTPHHAEWPVGSPQRLYHHAGLKDLKRIFSEMTSPLGLFLIAWLLSFSGSAALFSLYPVVMQKAYGVRPGLASAGYALAACLGLFLYAPAGAWTMRRGPQPVLRTALVLRIAAFIVLTILAVVQVSGRGGLALLSFLFVVLAWSPLGVSSAALVANLSPKNEGEGLGIFNAVTALSGVTGSVLGGWAAKTWGYSSIPVMGILGVGAGFIVLLVLRFKPDPSMHVHEEAC